MTIHTIAITGVGTGYSNKDTVGQVYSSKNSMYIRIDNIASCDWILLSRFDPLTVVIENCIRTGNFSGATVTYDDEMADSHFVRTYISYTDYCPPCKTKESTEPIGTERYKELKDFGIF